MQCSAMTLKIVYLEYNSVSIILPISAEAMIVNTKSRYAFSICLLFCVMKKAELNNYNSNLYFKTEVFYSQYNTSTIIIPIELNSIENGLQKLKYQLREMLTLSEVQKSKGKFKFIQGSLKEAETLYKNVQNDIKMVQSHKLKKEFVKRNALKDLVLSGFEVLRPLGDLPFLYNAGNLLVKFLRSNWNSTPKISSEVHNDLENLNNNMTSLRNQLTEQSRKIHMIQFEKKFLNLELTSTHILRKSRKFLRNVRDLLSNHKLPSGLIPHDHLEKGLKYVVQNLPKNEHVGISNVRGLLNSPTMMIMKKNHIFISILIPIFREEDKIKSYQLRNEYMLVNTGKILGAAKIGHVLLNKKIFLRTNAAHDEIFIIHEESCHVFSKKYRTCQLIVTEKLDKNSCIPKIFFEKQLDPESCMLEVASEPFYIERISPHLTLLVTGVEVEVGVICPQMAAASKKGPGIIKLTNTRCDYEITVAKKNYKIKMETTENIENIIEISIEVPEITKNDDVKILDETVFNCSSIVNFILIIIIYLYVCIRVILIKIYRLAPLG